jgi:hypothetical protein
MSEFAAAVLRVAFWFAVLMCVRALFGERTADNAAFVMLGFAAGGLVYMPRVEAAKDAR